MQLRSCRPEVTKKETLAQLFSVNFVRTPFFVRAPPIAAFGNDLINFFCYIIIVP